jgi:hypothetical protein
MSQFDQPLVDRPDAVDVCCRDYAHESMKLTSSNFTSASPTMGNGVNGVIRLITSAIN